MPNELCIFSKTGDILKSIDAEEVAKLSPEDMVVLEETLLACRDAEDAQANLAILNKSVFAMIKTHDAALKADNEANPPISHQEALQAVIAANSGLKVKVRKPNKETRATLATAISDLAEARASLSRAEVEFKTLSTKRNEAIIKWTQTQPVSFAEAHAAHVAAFVATPEPVTIYRHPIDALPQSENKNRQRTPANIKGHGRRWIAKNIYTLVPCPISSHAKKAK